MRPQAYTIEIRDASDVETLALESKDPALIDVLRQHFLTHPLADADGELFGEIPARSPQGAIASVPLIPDLAKDWPSLEFESGR